MKNAVGEHHLERPSSLLFLCLARDCAPTLPAFLDYLDQLRASGFECRVLIGENSSKDSTREQIQDAHGRGVELVDTSYMAAGATRLERMALGRELLLQATKSASLLAMYEFVCVADLDNVMTHPPTVESVRAAAERLRSDPALFGVSATSTPFYYDLLALRAPGHDYTTLHTDVENGKKQPLTYYRLHRQRIYDKQQEVTGRGEMICESAFNGFCLYRAKEYGLGSYLGKDTLPVSEHVHFNRSLARCTGKLMLISPELMLRMPVDHAPTGFFQFWLHRLRKLR